MLQEKIHITLLDGSVRSFPRGITGWELANTISSPLAKQALAIFVNDEVWDITRAIYQDAKIQLLTSLVFPGK